MPVSQPPSPLLNLFIKCQYGQTLIGAFTIIGLVHELYTEYFASASSQDKILACTKTKINFLPCTKTKIKFNFVLKLEQKLK